MFEYFNSFKNFIYLSNVPGLLKGRSISRWKESKDVVLWCWFDHVIKCDHVIWWHDFLHLLAGPWAAPPSLPPISFWRAHFSGPSFYIYLHLQGSPAVLAPEFLSERMGKHQPIWFEMEKRVEIHLHSHLKEDWSNFIYSYQSRGSY